ncbi:MAG: hypothetical protein M3R04_00585 [bacterium]|nr:hypothetical protein [bacterium]
MLPCFTLGLIALLLLCSGCNTTHTTGLLPFPVWQPQVTNANVDLSGNRAASVTINWRTGQGPFTVDIEMPGDFEQLAPITTEERTVTVDDIAFLVPEGTSGLKTYTVNVRVRDALGQVAEQNVEVDFDFPAM